MISIYYQQIPRHYWLFLAGRPMRRGEEGGGGGVGGTGVCHCIWSYIWRWVFSISEIFSFSGSVMFPLSSRWVPNNATSITCCHNKIGTIFFKKPDQCFTCGVETGSIKVVSSENPYWFDTPILLFEKWFEIIVLQKVF